MTGGVNTPAPGPSDTEYLRRILTADVYDVAIESPLDHAPQLSERTGNRVLLKREDLQPVFSFKLRGAYNKMAKLSPEERARGVIASSAGNHAQGVALAASHLGCDAVIVMPATAPEVKVAAVRDLGAEVVLHGETYSDAQAHARALMTERGLTFVHPFDDPDVIAGQGTIAMEILRQHTGPIGRGLRRHRRRRARVGDRHLRETAQTRDQGDRGPDGGLRRHGSVGRGG